MGTYQGKDDEEFRNLRHASANATPGGNAAASREATKQYQWGQISAGQRAGAGLQPPGYSLNETVVKQPLPPPPQEQEQRPGFYQGTAQRARSRESFGYADGGELVGRGFAGDTLNYNAGHTSPVAYADGGQVGSKPQWDRLSAENVKRVAPNGTGGYNWTHDEVQYTTNNGRDVKGRKEYERPWGGEASAGDKAVKDFNNAKRYLFADGGMPGLAPPGAGATGSAGGAPHQMGMPPAMNASPGVAPQGGAPMAANMFDMHTADMMNKNPQAVAAVKSAIDQGIQAGAVTPQQLQMVFQMAQACLTNPALWPQLRQYAIRQGLAEPDDLPEQFDQGLVYAILLAAKAYSHGNRPGGYSNGGMIQGPGTGVSDSIQTQNQSTGEPVSVSNGEYIVSADVVRAKGKDFFDNLQRKYHVPKGYKG